MEQLVARQAHNLEVARSNPASATKREALAKWLALLTFLSAFLLRRTLVDEIDDTHVRDACVRLEADLTGTAIGVAHLDMVGLDLWTEFAQTILIEFWEGESPVASEAAAAYALWQINLRGTHLGEINQIIGHAHLSCRTGDM